MEMDELLVDSLSEDNSDHLTQGNSKRSGKKDASSRRKSNAGAAASREDSDVQAKALKRKNQNRAAQKAFRERREQRVKDVSC
jgi:AP-1-like factor